MPGECRRWLDPWPNAAGHPSIVGRRIDSVRLAEEKHRLTRLSVEPPRIVSEPVGACRARKQRDRFGLRAIADDDPIDVEAAALQCVSSFSPSGATPAPSTWLGHPDAWPTHFARS